MLAVRLDQMMSMMKISNVKMGQVAGVSDTIVGRWRSGKAKPSSDNLLKIVDCLGCSADYILGRTDSVNGNSVALGEVEQWFLDKFRELDEDGVVAVRGVLLDEWRRCCLARGEGQNTESEGNLAQ